MAFPHATARGLLTLSILAYDAPRDLRRALQVLQPMREPEDRRRAGLQEVVEQRVLLLAGAPLGLLRADTGVELVEPDGVSGGHGRSCLLRWIHSIPIRLINNTTKKVKLKARQLMKRRIER